MHIVILFAGVVLITAVSGLAYLLLGGTAGGGKSGKMRDLMSPGARRDKFGNKIDADIDAIKRETVKRKSQDKHLGDQDDIRSKLFRAGYYRAQDRKNFLYFQIAAPIISTTVCTIVMIGFDNPLLVACGIILGAFIGLAAPMTWLERKIRARQEETMYFLPLVIEQIAIGVSSALDIGPCIAHIVSMAKERDSHNPITEMFIHAEKLIVSGLNLEDSLVEVSEAHAMPEVRHAFMFLAQCSKHGGEISRQLQELANAVMTQRQVQIEGRITALPVKATMPLTSVFFGFFLLLGAGIFVRLLSAFGA
jgi:Flp pilus assembly protein TadB